ncbi:MAG: methyltransferase domain-containing protein [Hyphomicrobiaceae bacterium]
MTVTIRTAVDFYERHPISAQIILSKLETQRGTLEGLKPEDLFAHDQDHYGGLAVNDTLAERAELRQGLKVADFCAGLGGPARYYAHRYGVDVTGIELTPARVAGAAELTRRVGMQDRVRVIEGDVMAVPLADQSQDAVLSQEAFLHVPDHRRTFAEAFRILKSGGRFAFTNWTVPQPLNDVDRKLMWDGMAVQTLHSKGEQLAMLSDVGFSAPAVDDVSAEWAVILKERLAMYQKLRGEAQDAAAPAGHDAFYESYVRFVELVQTGGIGGGRFWAIKP